MRLDTFRSELDRLLVSGHSFTGVALLQVAFAKRHRTIELI